MSPLWWTSIFLILMFSAIVIFTTMKKDVSVLKTKTFMKKTENKMKW